MVDFISSIGASMLASSALIQSLRSQFRKSPAGGAPCIVNENIRIGAGGENGVPPFLRRDVSYDGDSFRAGCRPNFACRAFQDFAAPCNDNELYAFAAKGGRTAPAQTHARRTDNCRAAPKAKIHLFPRPIASRISQLAQMPLIY